MEEGQERRKSPRRDVVFDVHLTVGDTANIAGRIVNLSMSGCYVLIPMNVHKGDTVQLHFDGVPPLHACVVHCIHRTSPVKRFAYSAGLHFADLQGATQDHLKSLLASS